MEADLGSYVLGGGGVPCLVGFPECRIGLAAGDDRDSDSASLLMGWRA
jgi:hypothetical protein